MFITPRKLFLPILLCFTPIILVCTCAVVKFETSCLVCKSFSFNLFSNLVCGDAQKMKSNVNVVVKFLISGKMMLFASQVLSHHFLLLFKEKNCDWTQVT